jgi:phage-related protein
MASPFSKKIGNNLFELRVRGNNAIRLIYCFSKKRIVVLHAFKKKTNKIPQRELKTAVDRMKQII